MKTRLRLGLWSAFLACWYGLVPAGAGLAATDALPLQRVLSEPSVEDRLKRGTSSAQIAEEFGPPDEVLPSGVWVYWNMACADTRSGESGYDTLVVQFDEGRLRKAKLVRGDALRALLARHESGRALVASP
ncbi:MAG TPA: hypothetical protein PKX00_07680 [Opitutaceae bacterium]|nr:hypothetical protein [Opitutaceae bacterium]